MLAGELYNPLDKEISAERIKTRLLLKELNESREDKPEKRAEILQESIPNVGENLWLQPPLYCDYGYNISCGEKVFFNFNCVVLDMCEVKIGSRTLFGLNVQIYTATHSMNHIERASGKEFVKPTSIGEDIWVYGRAVR